MNKIKQQSDLATKKNTEILNTNKALKTEIEEGNSLMGKYSTEISTFSLSQNRSTLKRSTSSRRSSTAATKRSKLWSVSSTKMSSLRIL